MTATLKNLLLVVVGLGAGLAVASWFAPAPPPVTGSLPAVGATTSGSAGAPSSVSPQRLTAIEQALAAEIAQRTALEARVAELAATLEAARALPAADRQAGDEAQPQRPLGDRPFLLGERQRSQTERLVAAGFSPDRAAWIERRVEELRMQAIQAQYDATRDGRPFDPGVPMAATRTLRSEIGDDEYERYLDALGRATSVRVQDVLASSPGEQAGLVPGDEVLRYGGERVFDPRELNALTLEGTTGEPVVVDVRRNGQTIQLVVPRGPLGITGGGFRGR